MITPKDRTTIIIDDLPDSDEEMNLSTLISSVETLEIDTISSENMQLGKSEDYSECVGAVREADSVYATLSEITTT